MKLKIAFIIFLLYFQLNGFSQNPESGWFWTLSQTEYIINNDSSDYDTMGKVELPTGKDAFEFSSSSFIHYKNGWMGKEYKEKEIFTVLKREYTKKDENFATYEYIASSENKVLRILVKVLLKDFELAVISIYENLIPDKKMFKNVTSYECTRHYK